MSHFKKLRMLTVKCSYLDENGNQCRQKAIFSMDYHGDPEIYEYPKWAKVYWCLEHAIKHGFKRSQP